MRGDDRQDGGEGSARAEQLLLPQLVARCAGRGAAERPLNWIIESLLESPLTDAERAGERLLVFGWRGAPRDGVLLWEYRVVGEASGRRYTRFRLSVRGADSEVPLAMLGLQLQIVLNGIEQATASEMLCYFELADTLRAAG